MDIAKIGQILTKSISSPSKPIEGDTEKFAFSFNQDLPSQVTGPSELKPNVLEYYLQSAARPQGNEEMATTAQQAVSAYKAQIEKSDGMSGLQKYADDQLLRNPGGHGYDLREKKVDPDEVQSLTERVGKDLTSAFDNIKNFFANSLFGAKFCYRGENNQILEGRHRGVVGSIIDSFKNLGSALSFGYWRPGGDAKLQGFGNRLVYSLGKLYQAFSGDLLGGITGGVNHMANDLLLAGWNLAEVVPDATLGNIPAGEKLTSKIFDGGQVLIDYVVDVIPSGEAWKRVHAFSVKELKLPVLHNIAKKERNHGDARWSYVRNTPFRKTIETLGALLADVASYGLSRWITGSSGKERS